jgi:hypothetical protein
MQVGQGRFNEKTIALALCIPKHLCDFQLQTITAGDLELDQSHLDITSGSTLRLRDNADLEVEDDSSMFVSDKSKLIASNQSNVETRLAHVLIEKSSSVLLSRNTTWVCTQEADFTPALGKHFPPGWVAYAAAMYIPVVRSEV